MATEALDKTIAYYLKTIWAHEGFKGFA